MSEFKYTQKGAVIVPVAVGTAAAIGAAVADKHHGVGAAVGVSALVFGAATLTAMGGGFTARSESSKGLLKLASAAIGSAAVLGGGGALGATIGKNHPSIGAAIGAAAMATIGVLATGVSDAPQANGQISGAPCNALARVSAGAFP